MRKSRADRAHGRAALLLALALAGCGVVGRLGASVRQHPASLVGAWVDVAKTTTTDSSIWVLAANGDDDLLRVRRESSARRVSRTRYGYWYARTDAAGATSLCVTRRPGRDPASCTLVAIVDGTPGARRRMLLAAYAGAHGRAKRELVEGR